MYAVIESSRTIQRAVCMLLSAAIVTIGLSLGAYGLQSMQQDGYSAARHQHQGYTVTIAALQ